MTNLAFDIQTDAKDWLGQESSKFRQTFGVNCFSFNPQNQTTSAHHAPFGHYNSPQPIYYQIQGDYDLPVNPSSFNPDKEPRWAINKYDSQQPISYKLAKEYKRQLNPKGAKQAEMSEKDKYGLEGHDDT